MPVGLAERGRIRNKASLTFRHDNAVYHDEAAVVETGFVQLAELELQAQHKGVVCTVISYAYVLQIAVLDTQLEALNDNYNRLRLVALTGFLLFCLRYSLLE